ncbi:MAG: hypothetical protein FWF96_06620, partial [Kiritimatiellaeota bacterium]|nr:hypothetical protein [Kiritimatiellota bacterium]
MFANTKGIGGRAMARGLCCGALLALWAPLPWRFWAAVCGDTAFLLRAHMWGALAGAALAFCAAQCARPAKRPHGAVLSAAFVFAAVTGLFPLVFTDSIYETWQNLLFHNAGPDRAYAATRAWGAVSGLATGMAAGLLAASLPAPRKLHPPVFLHLLLGAVAARALVRMLPAPPLDVSLRTATLLLAAFVASLGFCHKAGQRRLAAGFVLSVFAAALAAFQFAIPASRGVPLEHLGPFGWWAALDH